MKCPRCVQKIHRGAELCPHCGFSVLDLELLYGAEEVHMSRLSDLAGVLRLKERHKAVALLDQFEKVFPQLFFSVHFGALDERANIRQFGMWLLNKAAYEDVDIGKPNDAGILLVVDVNSKSATISFGYFLDRFLTEEDTFQILSKAHPYFLQGSYLKALKVILHATVKVLKKRSKYIKRRPELYQDNQGSGSGIKNLKPIRNRVSKSDTSVKSVPSVENGVLK